MIYEATQVDTTGTSPWSYDSLGRLAAATNGAGSTLGFSYDLAGRPTTLAYPGGTQNVARTYDGAGRLRTVADWSARTTTFSYDADSDLVGTAYPNGTAASVTVDRTGAPTGTALTAGAATLASLAYARDGAGQVASQSGTGVGQPSETYGYSALEQLKTLNGTTAFAYDAADDLTRLRGTAQAFDAASQITSSTPDGGAATAYGYDARGNRTSATPPGAAATAYGYDQESRLVNFNAGAATYAYDGNGLRSSKTAGGTTTAFTWDPSGGLPLVVKAATTAYVYGPGGLPLEQVAADGTTQWFFHDQLGSTRALTDSTGAVVATRAYDPYGKVIASTGTASTPFGFAGEWTDAESGFVYLRARFYDPATGQFLTRDPLVSVTRSPYGYVEGNPLNGTDPAGLSAWGWAKKHALEIAVVTVVAAVVACTVSVVCGLAVAGAVSAVSVVAGNAMLLGAAGIGTAGAIARALGGAPGCSEPAEGSPAALDATPGGRIYSAHYLEDTGPVRNIPGSVVDEVIDHGQVVERLADRTIYYQQANDMTVVQSETTGKIMSVRKGAP